MNTITNMRAIHLRIQLNNIGKDTSLWWHQDTKARLLLYKWKLLVTGCFDLIFFLSFLRKKVLSRKLMDWKKNKLQEVSVIVFGSPCRPRSSRRQATLQQRPPVPQHHHAAASPDPHATEHHRPIPAADHRVTTSTPHHSYLALRFHTPLNYLGGKLTSPPMFPHLKMPFLRFA